MIINICTICQKEFTRPHNPNKVFKYCSCKCMGADKNKAENHSKKMKGHIPWNKGVKGLKPWMNITGLINKIPWNKGKENPYFKGENNHNWKGGISPINEKIRHSIKYKNWRMKVLRRDHFSCVKCGYKSTGKYKEVVVDHIKPFSLFPELRFKLSNGRTLCSKCDSVFGWNFNRSLKEA